MRILFVSANRIGDAVIASGVLDHLARQHPGARITVACGAPAAGVYARMPQLDRIIVFDKRRDDTHWPKLWRQVAFTVWDLVVDLRGSALAWLIPARRRVVRRKRPGRMFEQHAAMLGISPPPLPVNWTGAADEALAARTLPGGRAFVGLGATANWAPKVWPADRFAELFGRLSATLLPGAAAAVFGGPGEAERALAAPLLAALPGAVDLVGRLSIPEAAACVARCALFVGNDSGLMHVAAASGVPTLGLFGNTADKLDKIAPAGRRVGWAVADGPTMAELSVDAVADACRALLT